MTPVYQTIVDGKKGNCMQAAFASLFDLKLEEVPNFVEIPDWNRALWDFVAKYGYEYNGMINNPKDLGCWGENRFHELEDYEGVNGYFYGVVYSPKFFTMEDYFSDSPAKSHAVIVDREANIVHDPNPEYNGLKNYPLANKIGYNGLLYVYLIEKIQPNERT